MPILIKFLIVCIAVTLIGCVRDSNEAGKLDGSNYDVGLDLYGDGLYQDRWQWLIDNGVIDGTLPDEIPENEIVYYIDGFTYAMRTKVDAWRKGSDFWWSPFMVDNSWQSYGYYMGHLKAHELSKTFTYHGRIDLVNFETND